MVATIGLVLATLDFTGLSKRIEKSLRAEIEATKEKIKTDGGFLKHTWQHTREIYFSKSTLIMFCIPIAGLLLGVCTRGLPNEKNPGWTVGDAVFLSLVLPIIWIPSVIIFFIFHGIMNPLIYGCFRLLSLPPAGILGTVGLLVAIVDWYFG
jgi:hypothetical protein